MLSILDLPNEILLTIGEHLPTSDVKNLRLTCLGLSRVYQSELLSSVTVDFKVYPVDVNGELTRLRELASGLHPACGFVRRLTLDTRPSGPRLHYGQDDEGVKAEIKNILMSALASLKNLNTLEWKADINHDEIWFYEDIGTYLKACHIRPDKPIDFRFCITNRDMFTQSRPSDDIWNSLKKCGIHSKSIDTNIVSPPLVEYIQSYAAKLQRFGLTICRHDVYGYNTMQDARQQVFTSLLQHSSSLEILNVMFEDWELTPVSAQMLLQFPNLKTLAVGVDGAFFNGERLRVGNLPLVMETAQRLPHLRNIRPFFVDLNDMYKSEPINDALRIFLRNFRLASSAPKPPTVRYYEQAYRSVLDDSGKFWVYTGEALGREFDETSLTSDESWPDGFNAHRFYWEQLGGDAGSELVYPSVAGPEEG